ncbi:MAG: leucine-rich repeat domain-containing protein, partial [Clostridiales bacterium]|nr:leucine-rich repeat domain-containing protein [Clostridiales bacterium]
MEKLRKITALFLAAALLLPMLPGAAWATEVTEETFVVEAAAEEAATEENTDEAQETSPESSVSVETEDDVASETETAAEPAVVSEEDIATASTEASGKCGASLTWTLDSDGTLTISGSGTMYDFNDYEGDDISPWYDYSDSITAIVIGDSVTSIGEYAFQCLACVTSVTIGSGVKTIGGGAFIGCENVKSIKIPDSVTSIGDYAFAVCNAMTKLTIGSSVKTIGDGAFSGCRKLTSVTIPNSATSIGEYAFDECIRLSSVTIGSGVTKIGEGAFINCLKLSGVTIPATVTSIGDRAFGYLSLDEMYDFEDVDVPAHGSLDDYGYATITGFTIKGYSGSAAQTYAKEWGLTFVALDSDALATPSVTLANVSSGIKVSWGKV